MGFHCPECTATKSQRVIVGPVEFTPVLTTVLVAFNVAIWFASTVQGVNFFADYALWGPLVADGEWYRIVTSGFLHDGVFHLGFNCFALWIMGKSLEQFLGRPRFAGFVFCVAARWVFGRFVAGTERRCGGCFGWYLRSLRSNGHCPTIGWN